MSVRLLTFVGLPLLLLGLIAYFLVFADSPTARGPEGGRNDPAGDQIAVGQSAELAGAGEDTGTGASGAGREELVDFQARYDAALSGYRGRVVDHGGRPLPGRLVRFYRVDAELLQLSDPFAEEEAPPMQLQVQEGRTDEAGEFLVTGAWPYSIYILEADAEGDDRLTRPIDRAPASGEIVDLGDIQLVQLGVIVGRVVDDKGAGVADAMVRAADIPGMLVELARVERFDPEGALIIREGTEPFVIEMPKFVKQYFDLISKPISRTDADGFFRLSAVQPGENVVAVNKKSFVPVVKKGVKVEKGKERDVGELRIRVGEEAFVKVVDPDENPVAGAEVLIAATSLAYGVDFATRVGTTDAKGEIYETGFPGGQVTVAARRSRNHPWVTQKPESVAGDVLVRLPGRHHFDLTIRSATGAEIGTPKFKLMPSPDEGVPLDAGALGFIQWIDLTGKVKLREDGRYRVEDLIPGKYTLAVSAPRHASAKIDFKIEKSGAGTIELRPEAVFVVHVRDFAGKPVHLAKIYIQTREEERGRRLMDMPIVAGETDKRGQLRVGDGEAGKVRLSASHPAFGYAHAEIVLPTADPVVLQMESPGRLAGVLRENGRVPTPGKWSLVLEPRRRKGPRGAMPDMPKITVPDLEGNFVAAGLNPGSYRLRVVKSVSALTSPGGLIGFMMRARMLQDTATLDVDVVAGETTVVDMEAIKEPKSVDGPSARISGTVLVNGRPGAGMMVLGRRRSGVTADDAGRFDLGAVPAGKVTISVRDPAQADVMDFRMESHLWRRTVEVADGQDFLLDIEILTGSVSGTVRKPGGGPAAGVRIKAAGRTAKADAKVGNTATALGMTDSSGRYSFVNLPAATYRIEVQDVSGYGAAVAAVEAGGRRVAVDIDLRIVHTATGRVDMAVFGKDLPRWSYLQLRRGEGEGMKGASVRRDGKFRVDSLPAGTYTVSLVVPARGRDREARELLVRDTLVVVDRDLKDVVIYPILDPATSPPGNKSGGAAKKGSQKR